ncbi:MAG: endonuclease MutS2, partial [Planctomycetota bacterium]
MDDHTLAKLEFDHIREALARHCGCSLGKELARRLRPSTNLPQICLWMDQVREMSAAATGDAGLPPLGGVHDVRPHLVTAATPAGLEPEALAEVGE